MKKIFTLTVCTFIIFGLNACAGWQKRQHNWPGYKITVVQGNELTQEQFSGLHTGMTKDAVINLLGQPQLANPFRNDTWHYVYTVVKADKIIRKSELILHFNGTILSNISGQFTPFDPDWSERKKSRKK